MSEYKPFTSEELDHLVSHYPLYASNADTARLLSMARRALELEEEKYTLAERFFAQRVNVEKDLDREQRAHRVTRMMADDWSEKCFEALRERDEARAERDALRDELSKKVGQLAEARGLVAYLRQFDDGPLTRGAVADCDEFLRDTTPKTEEPDR